MLLKLFWCWNSYTVKEIIHRDLKHETILFDENWYVLFIDFSSAKIVKAENDKRNNDSKIDKCHNSFELHDAGSLRSYNVSLS